MQFLCASNLRLGRRISSVPDHLNLDSRRLATSAVWNQIVDTAIGQDVHAVVLAGNIIDRENHEFEPLGPLERGLVALEKHGIPVIAIAGQQDFDTLPALATRLGDAIIVLDDDEPDQVTIENVTILGQSAADAVGRTDAFTTVPQLTDTQGVVLLPSSLTGGDAPNHVFQPLTLDQIHNSGADLWILGGQREPDLITHEGIVIIEPGAICPLDPMETGPYGAWIIDTDQPAASQHLNLSPIRFESIDIDITATASLEDIENRIVSALHETLAACMADDPLGQLVCVPCIVTLTGTTTHTHELADMMHGLASSLDIQRNGVVAAISQTQIDTHPNIDLAPLLERPDPVGELARLLTWLDGGDVARADAHAALLQRTVTRLQSVHHARVFATIASDPAPDVDTARDILRRESWNILDSLIRQRGVEA